ncbi:MAG: hypothetical protein DRH24_00565 [Deltaproteobacteria bacterium]|nr:MAG: hypothetical protein DRH24_00565 [Deltaproteobacteria bacterium]HGY12475.1 hypothetical protein [Desulfobacterales bacterium]
MFIGPFLNVISLIYILSCGAALNMRLNNLLAQRKTAIIKNWFTLAVETYPPDTASFLKRQKDPFANPVGRTVSLGLEALFNELLKEMDYEIITSFLDPIVRIRAIQNFSPSQAVSFIFLLKKAIRENIKKEALEEQLFNELLLFESKIDQLVMIAFNLYMQCKEKIYDLKANEMRNSTYKAFKRAGLVRDWPVDEPDIKPNINV